MSKRIYRAVDVNAADLKKLELEMPEHLVIGLDIGKKKMVAVLMASRDRVLATLKWQHPQSTRPWIAWLSQLPVRRCEVVMEPSGSYGDSLREALQHAGIAVYRVRPKQVHDARELYDGVPSSHDAKSGATIGWLHYLGRSTLWEPRSCEERELSAAVRLMQMHGEGFQRVQNRLEAQLASYWPEVLDLLALDSVSLLSLLERYGSPRAVSQDSREAGDLLKQVGGPFLRQEKVEQVLQSARWTLGVEMLAAEERALRSLAGEGLRQLRAWHRAQAWVRSLAEGSPWLQRLGEEVGVVTACVLSVELGRIDRYPSARCLLKSAGLNLKERSSGRRQGQLAITKRGPSRTRQLLYLAVLRWIQKDPTARAWYEAKLARDGGRIRRRALIALMRKLLAGLWWVGQGHAFDSRKLFDPNRLQIAA